MLRWGEILLHQVHLKKPTVHWISHRGYHIQFVENSKKAFDAACAGGFAHLETDLRSTRDGVLVLCHDPDLVRVGGPKKKISDMTAAEVQSHVLADGSRVMLFEDFYQCFGQTCQVTLDFKPEHGERTVQVFLKWVEKQRAAEWVNSKVTFLFWKASHEAMIKKHFPKARYYARRLECLRAGLALFAGLAAFAGIQPGRTYAVPPRFLGISMFSKKFVEPFHQRNARVVAFLPNSDAEVQAAVEAGMDEILTNGQIVRS